MGGHTLLADAARKEAYGEGATLRCGGALERGDGGAPEPLKQLDDALGGVGAAAMVDAAELVAVQAASTGEGGNRCQRGLARAKRAGATLRRHTRAR